MAFRLLRNYPLYFLLLDTLHTMVLVVDVSRSKRRLWIAASPSSHSKDFALFHVLLIVKLGAQVQCWACHGFTLRPLRIAPRIPSSLLQQIAVHRYSGVPATDCSSSGYFPKSSATTLRLRYRQQGTLVSLSLCKTRSVSEVHTTTLGQVCTPCIGDWT